MKCNWLLAHQAKMVALLELQEAKALVLAHPIDLLEVQRYHRGKPPKPHQVVLEGLCSGQLALLCKM